MANFNRSNRSGERGFSSKGGSSSGWDRRGGFGNRERRGSAEMHKTICDKCRKECEVPFRPTSGKPVFCNDCFKSNGDFDSKRLGGRNSEERKMFEAVCNECANTCRVPFQPSGGKPVYCSSCFGEKKGAGDRNNVASQPQFREQFEVLNNKLDKILVLLTPTESEFPAADDNIEDVTTEEVIEPKKSKVKKSPSKKK